MRATLFVIVFGLPSIAAAQALDSSAIDDKIAPPDEEQQGWKVTANIAANLSYSRVQNVVGAVDGDTWQIGGQLNAAANFVSGKSLWENTLSLNFAQTRNPTLPVFVKSTDELKLDTLYLYRVDPWWGPFAQGTFTTSVARGFDVRAEDVQIQRTFIDDPTNPVILDKAAFERFRLTDPFEPIKLSEVVGVFANAYESEKLNARFKLGAGGEQIIAGTGFVLNDDDTTDVIEYTQLDTSSQLGAVADARFSGTLVENVSYSLAGRVFYAAYSNYTLIEDDGSTRDLEGSELFSLEVDGKLTAKLADWAALEYVLIFKRIPWVVNANQVTNGVLVNITYDLI